jgi:sec-independent protein translocase protein TatC
MDEFEEKLKEYSPYLEDLFRRIYIITIAFIGFFVIGFFLAGPIIKLLTSFFDFKDVTLATTSPFQFVGLAMDAGLFFAMIFCIPLCVYHLYKFTGAGLRKKERAMILLILPLSLILFLLGFAYCFSILYFTMQTLATINVGFGFTNLWDISMFLSQIISTSVLLGLLFEFPILMTVLVKFEMFNVNFLKEKRRHVFFVMFILTSLLPPTDGISLLLMVLPLIVMYEATIIYNMFDTGH